MIQTTIGKIQKVQVKGSYIFAHEHLDFNLSKVRNDDVSVIKNDKLIIDELDESIKLGLGLIVDSSNQSMDSNKDNLYSISKKLNIPVVSSTGYYLNKYEINNKLSVEDISKEFKEHILNGVGKYNVKAGMIGEIATSSDKIHSFEKKVFTAAINVQKQIGIPIYTHVDLGKKAKEQVDMILNMGGFPEKIVIGHMELAPLSDILYALDKGFYIGIDTIGKEQYLSDSKRAELIINLIKKGHEDKIVLSLDISKKTYLQKYGGHGYTYLIKKFNKLITNKVSEKQLRKILFLNILDVLDY